MSIYFHLSQLLPKNLQDCLSSEQKKNLCPEYYLDLINPYIIKTCKDLNIDIIIENFNIDIKNIDCPNLNKLYRFMLEHYTNNDKTLRIYAKNLLYYYFSCNESPIIFVLKLKHTDEIVGCISCVKKNCIYDSIQLPIYLVNFLCVHKNYRNSLFGLYLILELTKYVKLIDPNLIWIFNTHKNIENSFANIKYYTRPINIYKLIKYDYFQLPYNTPNFCDKIYNYFNIDTANIFDLTKLNTNLIDSKILVNKLNTFNSTKMFSCIIYENQIINILNNSDFICLGLYESNNLIAYIDLYCVKEIKYNNIINIAIINNFFYPDSWNNNDKELLKFIDSIVFNLNLLNIDEFLISNQFYNVNFNDLQKFKLVHQSNCYINYYMNKIPSCEYNIINF